MYCLLTTSSDSYVPLLDVQIQTFHSFWLDGEAGRSHAAGIHLWYANSQSTFFLFSCIRLEHHPAAVNALCYVGWVGGWMDG